jgi:hypothetical protein
MGHTAMVAKSLALLFLVACHASPPSVTSGSGAGETAPVATADPVAHPPAPQIAAPAPAPVVPSPASQAAIPAEPASAPAAKPAPAPAAPTTKPAAPVEPSAGGGAAPGISEKCGASDACAAGLSCVSYYGFAGARGPQFKTCEMRCDSDKVCPKGRHCATVADGPGRVCR